MDSINFLSNEELIRRLLKVRKKDLRGSTIREMLEGLDQNESAWLVREICHRYGESRMEPGSAFNQSRQVYDYFKIRLNSIFQEVFLAITLDNKHRLISEHLITLGTLNKSLVHPREIFAKAIEQRAAAILLIHNHPSGDPQPSRQDIDITKRLIEVGTLVGIKVLDHIVIGDERYFSFADEDLM